MFRPNRLLGFEPGGFSTFLGPRIPYTRPSYSRRAVDPRTNPATGGGRRLAHPFLDDIVYPENPSRTVGFDFDVLRTMKSVLTRTEGGTALLQYPDYPNDVVITETWDAGGGLKIEVEFVRKLYQFLMTPLPVGQYLGWQPRDLCPYFYLVALVDVKLGANDQYHLEEVGEEEPYMLTEPLSIMFKTIQPSKAASSVIVLMGA